MSGVGARSEAARRAGGGLRRVLVAVLAPVVLILAPVHGAPAQEGELKRLRIALPEGASPRTLGYHLAKMDGEFAQLGLDPLFVPADERGPVAMLEDGDVDLAIDLMPHALRARENGADILHIAQVFQKSGLMLACRRPIAEPADLKGATVELRFDGQEGAFFAWMHKLGLGIYGEADGITILREGREPEAYRGRESDCFTTESYALPQLLAAAGKTPADFRLFSYEELGTALLEDGVYARDEDLADPERVDLFVQFLAGARYGWTQVADEPRKSAERLIGLMPMQNVDLPTLIRGVWAVNDLVAAGDAEFGHLDPAAYDRTVTVLLTGAPEPSLKNAPLAAISETVIKRLRPE